VIDAGAGRASNVPTALINPVRGYQGRLLKRGPEGARLTFALIDHLRDKGHAIACGRGLWRPVPDAEMQKAWAEQLPAHYPHRWHEGAPEFLGLRGTWHATLELPESGWVDGPALVEALLRDCAAERIDGVVASLDAHDATPPSGVTLAGVTLADGTHLRAHHLLWCGGAWGAQQLRMPALYRPGSIVRTRAPLGTHAVSHGLYATPCGAGSALGPTRESSSGSYRDAPAEAEVLDTMLQRAGRMFAAPIEVEAVWHGVRLGRVNLPAGLQALGPFGARGFLMAPLEARAHAQRAFGLAGGAADPL